MRRTFTGTLARLGGDTVTVQRTAKGQYVNGLYVENATISTFEATGSLQPITDKDLQFLTEGERADEVRKFYTETRLYVGDVKDEFGSDRLIFDRDVADDTPGDEEQDFITYEVVGEWDRDHSGSYFRYKLRKVAQ